MVFNRAWRRLIRTFEMHLDGIRFDSAFPWKIFRWNSFIIVGNVQIESRIVPNKLRSRLLGIALNGTQISKSFIVRLRNNLLSLNINFWQSITVFGVLVLNFIELNQLTGCIIIEPNFIRLNFCVDILWNCIGLDRFCSLVVVVWNCIQFYNFIRNIILNFGGVLLFYGLIRLDFLRIRFRFRLAQW